MDGWMDIWMGEGGIFLRSGYRLGEALNGILPALLPLYTLQ